MSRRVFINFDNGPAIGKAQKELFPLCRTCGYLAKKRGWVVIGDIEQYATCLMLEHDFWLPCRMQSVWIRRRELKHGPIKWKWGKGEIENG